METKTNHPATFDSACPSRQVLEMLSNKWTLLVMRLLSHGTHRYRELQREANGVTQKMLTQTLRELEKNGIVERTAFPVVPPKVEYVLTPIGETLIEALKSVGQWAEENFAQVEQARSKYKTGAQPKDDGTDE